MRKVIVIVVLLAITLLILAQFVPSAVFGEGPPASACCMFASSVANDTDSSKERSER
jgi:hypothetical protein